MRTEILNCPFDDIVPRQRIAAAPVVESKKKKSEVRAVKNLSLISFGDDEAEEQVLLLLLLYTHIDI